MKRFIKLACGAALILCGAGVTARPATAQPDPNNVPKVENPQNWPQRRDREAQRRQMRENSLRRIMALGDITDQATQDAIIAFTSAEEEAREPLRRQMRELGQALGAKALNQPAVTDAELEIQLQEFRDATTKEKARRATALAELDAKIKFSTNPRLTTFMTLIGYTDDDAGNIGGGLASMIGGNTTILANIFGGAAEGRAGGFQGNRPPIGFGNAR